jgi:hypothetical protein
MSRRQQASILSHALATALVAEGLANTVRRALCMASCDLGCMWLSVPTQIYDAIGARSTAVGKGTHLSEAAHEAWAIARQLDAMALAPNHSAIAQVTGTSTQHDSAREDAAGEGTCQSSCGGQALSPEPSWDCVTGLGAETSFAGENALACTYIHRDEQRAGSVEHVAAQPHSSYTQVGHSSGPPFPSDKAHNDSHTAHPAPTSTTSSTAATPTGKACGKALIECRLSPRCQARVASASRSAQTGGAGTYGDDSGSDWLSREYGNLVATETD